MTLIRHIKVVIAFVLVFMFFGMFGSSAKADVWDAMPPGVYDLQDACGSGQVAGYLCAPGSTFRGCDFSAGALAGFGAAFDSWLSPLGAPYASNLNVNYGDRNVILQLNSAMVTCLAANGLAPPAGSLNEFISDARTFVVGQSTQAPGQPAVNDATNLYYGFRIPMGLGMNGQYKAAFGSGVGTFNYFPRDGFTTSGYHTIQLAIKNTAISYRLGSGYLPPSCVGSTGTLIGDIENYSPCPTYFVNLSIYINVLPPADPTVTISTSCVLGSGQAILTTNILPNGYGVPIIAVGGSAAGRALNNGITSFGVPYSSSGTASAFVTNNLGRTANAFAGYACPADPNRPPTGSIVAVCSRNAAGFAVLTLTASGSDPEGDAFTVSGSNGIGSGFSSLGTFGPWLAPLLDAPSAFVGTASMVLVDSKGASSPGINASYTCPSNNRPIIGDPTNPGDGSKTISAVCSTAGVLPVIRELSITMYMRDPDGGFSPTRARATGPPYGGGVIANGNGNYSSPGNFPSPARDNNTYQVNFYANDAQSGVEYLVGSRTYFCYRNPITIPNDLNCAITSSGSIEPGAPLQPAVTVYNPFGLTGGITYTLVNANSGTNVPGTPQSPGNRSPLSGSFGAGYFNPVTMPSPGNYTQGATLAMVPGVPDDPTSATCGGGVTITVNNMPYFRVLYGDIVTYTDSVRGWNRGAAGGYTGASANGMILSANGICPTGSPANCGVASMSGAGTGPGGPLSPRSLTLSNSGGGTFGQGYGPGAGSFALPSIGSGNTLNSNQPVPAASGTYINENGNTVTLAGNTVNGTVTIYSTNVAGINIGGNIVANNGPYASIANIPRVRIVAVGPIYIWPSVTRIDAELISGDKIYTCHGGTGSWGAPGPINVNLYDAGCNSRLVVNGALMARNGIKMTRVQGTLRNSTASDGINNCSAPVANCDNIAELIRFMPDLYITKPGGNPTVSAELRYDAVTALSPLY